MFLDQHAFLHSGDITSGPSFFDQAFADLTDGQKRIRPGKSLNSLAWLLWHMARTEDVNVNLVIVDRGQVFDEAWARRLNVSRGGSGTLFTRLTSFARNKNNFEMLIYKGALEMVSPIPRIFH